MATHDDREDWKRLAQLLNFLANGRRIRKGLQRERVPWRYLSLEQKRSYFLLAIRHLKDADKVLDSL